MRAKVTVEFTISNLGFTQEELNSRFTNLDEMVRWLVTEEGLIGIVDEVDGTIIKVEEIEEKDGINVAT